MEYILVSACLLGQPVRYHGGDAACTHPQLQRWCDEGRVISVCPEVAAGMTIPRLPAEISQARGGFAVLDGRAAVLDSAGEDVTTPFLAGAGLALKLARSRKIRIAILKEGSPSCGTKQTYDGSFSGRRIDGSGVASAQLQQSGICVFGDDQIDEAAAYLASIEGDGANHT
jgi:uncharacterized protein YbbK (DUF523 family)